MHDPSTVAFTIKRPWPSRAKFMGRRYWPTLITIWHEDPMDFSKVEGGRSDDSCGWSSPLLRKGEREYWEKHAERQYCELFSKRVAIAEDKSYARVCYEVPDCYTAVYWIWRHIKHEHLKGKWYYRQPWQYGNRPSASEMEAIMNLATNPVDNLQWAFKADAIYPPGERNGEHDDFNRFFFSVLRCYRRHHRPWYRHPKWHVHHWRLQIHPWQTLRRWLFTRCCRCGERFAYGESPCTSSWDSERPGWFKGEKNVYHANCGDIRVGSGGPVSPADRALEDK